MPDLLAHPHGDLTQPEVRLSIPQQDFAWLVWGLTRYALGRRTYVVGIACDLVRQLAPVLTETERALLIRDIREQERFGYGDECDRRDWLALLEQLDALAARVAELEDRDGAE